MRVVLAALAALLLASPAWGVTRTVLEDDARDPDPSGYSASADTMILLRSYPGVTLEPGDYGTEERPKVWIGQGQGITFAGVVPMPHNRFYNLTFTSGVTFDYQKHVVFNGCTINGSLNMFSADSCSVRNCTIRGTKFSISKDVPGLTSADADTLEGNTFTSLDCSSGNPAMIFGLFDATFAESDSCRYFVQRFNTFNISQSGSGTTTTFSKHYLCPNFTSYHNTYNLTSTATSSGDEGAFGVLFRDCCYNGVMRGDRIFLNNEGGTVSHYALMWPSGGAANAASNHHFTVDSCYVRVFRGSAIYLKTQMPQLKIVNCVSRSRLGTAMEVSDGFEAGAGDPYIHHNTFLGKQAINFGAYANNGGGISNNVFWGTSTEPCDDWQAVGGTQSNLSAISDSNVVYSTTTNETRAFCRSSCSPVRSGQWGTTYGNDTHSYWANPAFSDTSWASLNVTPRTLFISSSGVFQFQYAGASDGTGETGPWGPASASYWYGSDGYFVQPDERWQP